MTSAMSAWIKTNEKRLKAEARVAELEAERDLWMQNSGAVGEARDAAEAKVVALTEALTDTTHFMELYSYRWDGVHGKHPQVVMDAARAALAATLNVCQASRGDGECHHILCPQERDGEPAATGRSCPLPHWMESAEDV